MAKWTKTPALVVVKGGKPKRGVVITKATGKVKRRKRGKR